MSVSSILKRGFSPVASVDESEDIKAVGEKLAILNNGAVVVLNAGRRLVGLISDNDFVRAAFGRRDEFPALRARNIMNANISTCSEDDDVLQVLATMVDKKIRHMPVTRQANVIGLLSIDQVVAYRLEQIRGVTQSVLLEGEIASSETITRHLARNLSAFDVYRAVCVAQKEEGLADLDARSREVLWAIGAGDRAGTPLRMRDLINREWGGYDTVRRLIGILQKRHLVSFSVLPDSENWRERGFRLTDLGQHIFERISAAVAEMIAETAQQFAHHQQGRPGAGRRIGS